MTATPLLPSLPFDPGYTHSAPLDNSAQSRINLLHDAAHEIRSPLACLKGYGDLLTRGDLSRDDLHDIGERIRRQAARLSETVEDILELTEIDAHCGANFRFRTTDVESILHDALDAIEPERSERVEIRIRNAPVPQMLADPARLTRALINVLDNALKYSDGRRRVTLSARAEFKNDNRGGPHLLIRVHDRGIGMSESDARQAFKRFFRSQAVSHLPGTGLGLAIAQQIVRLHRGELKLTTRLGYGTVVTMSLPTAQA